MTSNGTRFPVGAGVTLDQLDTDPHPVLAALREREPVSWVPVLDGWLVTRRDLCIEVMRDAERFTVDDPRFSTAQVVGEPLVQRGIADVGDLAPQLGVALGDLGVDGGGVHAEAGVTVHDVLTQHDDTTPGDHIGAHGVVFEGAPEDYRGGRVKAECLGKDAARIGETG